jgi:hypothetical protein
MRFRSETRERGAIVAAAYKPLKVLFSGSVVPAEFFGNPPKG